MKVDKTERGFQRIDFAEYHDLTCSLQQASAVLEDTAEAWCSPGSSGVWLGVNGHRMLLTRGLAGQIAKHLMAWAETGSLETP